MGEVVGSLLRASLESVNSSKLRRFLIELALLREMYSISQLRSAALPAGERLSNVSLVLATYFDIDSDARKRQIIETKSTAADKKQHYQLDLLLPPRSRGMGPATIVA